MRFIDSERCILLGDKCPSWNEVVVGVVDKHGVSREVKVGRNYWNYALNRN